MTTERQLGVDDLREQAVAARKRGDYEEAAGLFFRAAEFATGTGEQLQLKQRGVYCLWSLGRYDDVERIAREIADQARTEMYFAELVDALSVLVDRCMISGESASATHLLAEAVFVMERVSNEAGNYQVFHNMAVTYLRCEFPLPALELLDRALRLADNDADRAFTYGHMAGAYAMAALHEEDPEVARRHVHNGIYAASSVIEHADRCELLAIVTAHASRATLLNQIGEHERALVDATTAATLARKHALNEELGIALVAAAVAEWRLHRDPVVLEQIDAATGIARAFNAETFLRPAIPVRVEVLWSQGRFDEARAVLVEEQSRLERALRHERTTRWEHVQLGVSHRATEAISEADPLTGLPNRRYLGHWLPEVLDEQVPVCVAVLDLDGFKQVNDGFSYSHGDLVLQELATILQRVCRRGDAVVRLGGDEFVIVLRDTSPNDARTVLERLRQLIAARRWPGLPDSVVLTASVGVSVGSGATEAPRLLSSASEALQTAKRQGRDRIVFA